MYGRKGMRVLTQLGNGEFQKVMSKTLTQLLVHADCVLEKSIELFESRVRQRSTTGLSCLLFVSTNKLIYWGIHQTRFLFPFGREDSVVMYSMLFCNLSPDDWLASHETLCSDVPVNFVFRIYNYSNILLLQTNYFKTRLSYSFNFGLADIEFSPTLLLHSVV